MFNANKLLSNQKGDVLILVLIVAGILGISLSTLGVYSVNQANYINRVRESYQMMSGTESLAKMVAHSRNLAKQRLLQIGIDDSVQTFPQVQAAIAVATALDPLAENCDTDGMGTRLQAVGSIYYCLSGAANARPQVCIPRPDMSNEQICSSFDYSMNANGSVNFDVVFGGFNKKSKAFKVGELLAEAFGLDRASSRSTSRLLDENKGSAFHFVAGIFKSKTDDFNLFNSAMAAGGPSSSSSFFNLTTPPPDLTSGTTDADKIAEMAVYLSYIKTEISGNTGLLSSSSAIDISNYLTALFSTSLLSSVSVTNVNGLGFLNSYLDSYASLIDSGSITSASAKLATIRTSKLNYAGLVASEVSAAGSPGGTGSPSVILANSDWNEAIGMGRTNASAARVPLCTNLDRCVRVRAFSGNLAADDGKSFLQNVFVQ